jgi:hypothetical protein
MIKQYLFLLLTVSMAPAFAQTSQSSHIQGNNTINVQSNDTVAIAKGENNVAANRVGVIKGNKKGDTKISAKADHVTTIVSGRGKSAHTNIGVISDESK